MRIKGQRDRPQKQPSKECIAVAACTTSSRVILTVVVHVDQYGRRKERSRPSSRSRCPVKCFARPQRARSSSSLVTWAHQKTTSSSTALPKQSVTCRLVLVWEREHLIPCNQNWCARSRFRAASSRLSDRKADKSNLPTVAHAI